jgi:glycosyltransferase involved in cell wall biosynthesis
MKIALIAPPWLPVPPPAYGGTEAVVDGLARGLHRAGHDVTLFAHPDSSIPVPVVSILDAADTPVISDGPSELSHVLGAYEFIDDDAIVHDHTLAGPLTSSRASQLPVVSTNHGPYLERMERIFRSYPDNVNLVSISRSHARSTSIPSTVIHHGIDVSTMPMGTGDGGYALFLGRMAEVKGVHRAIEIARTAGTLLVIAAKMREPGEIEYFEKFVEPLLGDDAIFIGEVGAQRKRELLASATALVNPIMWPEPFGMVMIEALACGTPVIGCPHGAAPEIVQNGVHGFLDNDLENLAGQLKAIGRFDRTVCRRHIEVNFSVERMVDDHVRLYRRVAAQHAQTQRGQRRPALVAVAQTAS